MTPKYENEIEIPNFYHELQQFLCGSEIRIENCHPGGLGSILVKVFPKFFFLFLCQNGHKMAENGLKITKICSKMPKNDVELYSKILKIRCKRKITAK